jgi:ABC-type uncharacterized transport system fused permease/ATPase subunit
LWPTLRYLAPLAGARLPALLALALARTALANRLARVQGRMFHAAFLRQVPLFARHLAENVTLCLAAAAVESTAARVVSSTGRAWRAALTYRLHAAYFHGMTYYRLSHVDRRVPNPEQRVCEDAPALAEGAAKLLREVIDASVDAGFFAHALGSYTGTHRYTGYILAYILGAGPVTLLFAPNFGRLVKNQADLEGKYRHLHARLVANAEPVAFYGGIDREATLVRAGFRDAARHAGHVIATNWRYAMLQDFVTKYAAATVAVVLIIGPFFQGSLRPANTLASRASMLGTMRYHTNVVISLFTAVGVLAQAPSRAAKLAGRADRVAALEAAARAVAADADANTDAGAVLPWDGGIEFSHCDVITPSGAALVRDLSLRVPAGTNLLVTGPNGSGKSSLFRVLGGLWPLAAGCVRKPGGAGGGLASTIFYVPQRPYVTVGTLHDQIIYPRVRGEAADEPSAEELASLLARVDLGHLLARHGGPDAVVDWGSVLSLGEQQRLGMVRLFYHKPRFAILDECTSGVTTDMEARFCAAVRELGCTCVTISHRPALVAFHDIVLSLDGEGGWSVHEGARKRPEGGSRRGAARGGDAGACLAGMTAAADDGDYVPGRELAVAPPPDEPDAGPGSPRRRPPALALADTTLASRWRLVLGLLRRGAGKQVAAIFAVVAARSLLQDRMASLNGKTVEYVLRQDRPAFVRLIGLSLAQAAASSVLAPSLRALGESLALAWRRSLTDALHARYLKGKVFYGVSALAGVSDADARATADVARLADDLAALIPNLVKPLFDLAWFSTRLWALTRARGTALLYLYAALGWTALRAVTPDFGRLAGARYRTEGAFRAAHSRLRAHAESVAFFGGGAREAATVDARFRDVLAQDAALARARWGHAVADDFFAKQLPHNVTWALTVLYALDHATAGDDVVAQGALVNDMRYLAGVVQACFSAFGELLALHKRLAELGGGVTRVARLLTACDAAAGLHADAALRASAPSARGASPDALAFDGVDVVTPAGRIVARSLTFDVRVGRSMLVTGPNGAGKTSIFRVLGGLWPLASGRVHVPAGARPGAPLDSPTIFYVPQRPYTTIGTLRDQITYPLPARLAAARYPGADDATRMAALDSALDAIARVVRLEYLVDREGGWSSIVEWGDVLSLGEQQRLGMARLFFHAPLFGVLDEATNATSVDVETALYDHAASLGITLITVTQRAALLKHHAVELALTDGRGGWRLRQIEKVAATPDASPVASPRKA